ncbi:DoxX family protein [Hamadaea tsunoensis]|uniref:DoxX family protein n=1 Tax=Hamadaea tsunoensis TaxID=53368 RepID=UPI0004138216|nr:DoxX family protein [Hamadaea tsunoensis]
MNVVLWIVQILLGAAYILAGLMKATQPKEKLAPNMPWVDHYSAGSVKLIGTAELLGGIGLILPWALDVASWLTPVAAVGLAVVQVGAIVHHVRHGELKVLPVNIVMLALAVFVAIGRF